MRWAIVAMVMAAVAPAFGRRSRWLACGTFVGGAGKSFVVSRRTSSLLKRSPIPASPERR